jgi:hypothetical protein
MKISQKILEMAKQIVQQHKDGLPQQIPGFPSFWVAKHEDDKVRAFGTVEAGGVFYKIGTMK